MAPYIKYFEKLKTVCTHTHTHTHTHILVVSVFEWGKLKSYKGNYKHNLHLTTLKNNFVEA